MSVQNQNFATAPAATASATELLEGEALKRAVYKLEQETIIKIMERQHGVPTFSDNTLLHVIKQLRQLDKTLPWEKSVRQLGDVQRKQLEEVLERLRILLKRRHEGRFTDYERRVVHSPHLPHSESDIGYYEFVTSQGMKECMHWRGVPVFKTVYDFSIYSMMLWDLRPGTIIELGSGMGASAVWMADLLKAFNIDSHIYSVDLNKPELVHEGITFVQGDCTKVETIFSKEFLETAPHPWLFIEDAHVNVCGVLTYFHQFFTGGDYVVVEDSALKHDELGKFLSPRSGCYKVDARYTDFFGRNATCARDSIFVRI